MDNISNKESKNKNSRFKSFTKNIFGIFFVFGLVLVGTLMLSNKALATTPDQISGLKLWLDASQGVTKDGTTPAVDGDTIKQWNDRSTGGYNATQLTAGSRPVYKTNIINGQPVLRFNGAQNITTSAFLDSSFNTNFTFFIVTKKVDTSLQVTTSNQMSKWYSGITTKLNAIADGLTPGSISSNFISNDLAITTPTIPTIETYKYDGSHSILRFNSVLANSLPTTGNLGLSGSLTVGSMSNSTYSFNGDISEVIIYSSALNDSQIGQIESYLMTKYGITPPVLTPLIVFEGDSMTTGIGSTGGQNYPTQVQALLGLAGTYQISAAPGRTVQQMNTVALSEIDTQHKISIPLSVMTLLGGVNDITLDGADATTTYNLIVTNLQARRNVGYKVIVNTILPDSNGGQPINFETTRQTVNNLIRTNWRTFADGISDIASNSIMGPAGSELNTTYFADKLHLTNAGYGIVASYVTAAIKQIMDPIVISNIVATPSTTTANITWTTNQNGSTKINYGIDSSYGSFTTESDTSTRVLSHTANLSTLNSCTTYHFQTVSNDLNGNQVLSGDQNFTTTGCVPSTPNSLVSPGLYNSTQSVTLTATGSTYIKYDITSMPADCSSGISYTGPISIITTSTIYARACNNEGNSSTGTFAYTIDTTVPLTPVATPSSGIFNSTQSVTLTATGSDSIRYSTIETPATCSDGTLYSDSISVSSSQTIYVRACDNTGNSSTTNFVYVISPVVHHSSGGSSPLVITQFKATQQTLNPTQTPTVIPTPSVPFTPIVLSRIIKLSNTRMWGDDVLSLQTLLSTKGYDVGTPDGNFGPKTQSAVIAFQKANSLISDGSVGPNTLKYLNGNQTSIASTITSQPTITRILKLSVPRMIGDDVKTLQTYLNEKGYDVGTPDGIFGNKTKSAIIAFQTANDLTPDGLVGAKTREIMK